MRETEILVEQQPPQGVFVFDHAGLVINQLSLNVDMYQNHGGGEGLASSIHSASERRGNNLKGFKDLRLKDKAII